MKKIQLSNLYDDNYLDIGAIQHYKITDSTVKKTFISEDFDELENILKSFSYLNTTDNHKHDFTIEFYSSNNLSFGPFKHDEWRINFIKDHSNNI